MSWKLMLGNAIAGVVFVALSVWALAAIGGALELFIELAKALP